MFAEPKTNTQVKVSWQQNPNHTHYLMQTRKKGTTEWFEGEGDQPTANINDLEAGQSYEFRVGAYCMDNVLSFSPIIDFTMPEKKSKDFQCGLEPNVDLSNQTRYSGTLRKGQEFMAGDFAVQVLEATGADTFTGKAWIKVPYLGPMRIAVEFKDIQLNTNLQLIAGEVKTTYDPEWKNVLDINEVVGDVKEFAEDVAQLYDDIKAFLNNYKGTEEDKKKAGEFEKNLNENIKELLDNPNVSTEDKEKLVQSQKDNKEHWAALTTGKDCGGKEKSSGNGPNGADYYNLEADFECHIKPATEQAETVNNIGTEAAKKGCSMPEIVRRCDGGITDILCSDGNWETLIPLLKGLKNAIVNKSEYTYTKNLTLDTGSKIKIGKTIFNDIFFDFSSMATKNKKVNAVSYTKEVTQSYSGSDYWTLNFDEVLWIKIPKVVQAGKDVSKTKIDYLEKWLKCGKEEDAVATTTKPPAVPLNAAMLQDVFKDTDPKRLAEVAAVINKYSDKFEINTPLRMSHFLAQTGYESGGFNDIPVEGSCYRPTTIVSTFKGQTWQSSNNLEGGSRGSFKCLDFRNSADNVPKKYVCKEDLPSQKIVNVSSIAGANLFNYTYRSEFGNGKFETGDGYKYRGRGIIQLTWKDHYIEFNDWLESNGYPNKDIITEPDLVATDFELATLSAMWYWKKNELNEIADDNSLTASIVNKNITQKINTKRLGESKRLEYQQAILDKLKN